MTVETTWITIVALVTLAFAVGVIIPEGAKILKEEFGEQANERY